jgi:hypothetical protein
MQQHYEIILLQQADWLMQAHADRLARAAQPARIPIFVRVIVFLYVRVARPRIERLSAPHARLA